MDNLLPSLQPSPIPTGPELSPPDRPVGPPPELGQPGQPGRPRNAPPPPIGGMPRKGPPQPLGPSMGDTGRELPDRPPLMDADGNELPPPPLLEGTMPKVWIYQGQAYDLTDFIDKHPGGAFFIGRMQNRDITTLINIFHPNPEKAKQRLKKYALDREARPEDMHPKYNAPPFLFRDGFDGWRDTPKFKFEGNDQLLRTIKARLKEPEMKKTIDRMDTLFDIVSVLLLIVYIAVQVLRLNLPEYMPSYWFVPLMVMLRISLSGTGHYLIHRPQVGLNKLFENVFDINYVPMAFVVTDGHTLMHHPYTQSEVDIKRNVFTAMLELPRFYRVPIHTVHKLGHVIIGMYVRMIEICTLALRFGVKELYGSWQQGLPHYIGTIMMRVLLSGELVLFALKGDLGVWLAQFVITLWISTFMIVASHDFEEEESIADLNTDQDWVVFQIKNSYDLTMIGNKYIDCFLSAGLSPHRVHHVLPYQRSGFANIASEDIVREESAHYDVEWLAPKNFFIDRLPIMAKHYLLGPSRWSQENQFGLVKEHLHPEAIKTSVTYIAKGFMGIGSI
jgi:Cytochrome b5-like Heme/Steroid binding domain